MASVLEEVVDRFFFIDLYKDGKETNNIIVDSNLEHKETHILNHAVRNARRGLIRIAGDLWLALKIYSGNMHDPDNLWLYTTVGVAGLVGAYALDYYIHEVWRPNQYKK